MYPDSSVLKKLIERIVDTVHPLRIILFGSAARGDMRPDSDIDVLVVVPEGTHRRRAVQEIYMNVRGLGAPVDVVVATDMDLDQFGDNFSLVYYPALREGREIYVAQDVHTRLSYC